MANVFQEAPQVVPVENTRVTDSGTSTAGSGADLRSQIWSEMQKTTGDSQVNGQLGSTTSSDSNSDSLSQERVKDSGENNLPSIELFDSQKDSEAKTPAGEPSQDLPKGDGKKDSGDPKEPRANGADPKEAPIIPADPKGPQIIIPAPREGQVIERKS